jgi:hypothetical protein
MKADGFPDRSTVFLDVEYVNAVTPALLEYYRAWIAGVVRDGHYRPGVYAAKFNATTLYVAAIDAFHSVGSTEEPPFWIAASTGFSLEAPDRGRSRFRQALAGHVRRHANVEWRNDPGRCCDVASRSPSSPQ